MKTFYLYGNLRLYRTIGGTEITNSLTRFVWNQAQWTMIPSGDLDADGDPIPAAWVNDVNIVFPKPDPLDLLGVVNHVRLYGWMDQQHVASSGPLNLTLSIVGQQVVFAPGALTLNTI